MEKKCITTCENFLINGKCNSWIVNTFLAKQSLPDDKDKSWGHWESKKADDICSKCKNYEPMAP